VLVVIEDSDRYYDCYTNRDVSYKVCNSVADLKLNFINHSHYLNKYVLYKMGTYFMDHSATT